MTRFEHIFFVCQNRRDPGDPRGSCAARGSEQLLARFKQLVEANKLKGRVRATASGCLDLCAKGCCVVVFSRDPARAETWYTRVRPEDADELFRVHVLEGRRLERLAESFREKD